MLNFLEIHNQMAANSIALTFKGNVTFELIDSIIMIISDKLDHVENDLSVRKKVYGVLTECLQNLCNHIDKLEKETVVINYDVNSAIIMVDTDPDGYLIKTGNFITASKVDNLKIWLNEINTYSKDELKDLYNRILTNKVFSEKGGGGLGFVDIARKSGQKLEFDFQPVDNAFSFFSFQIKISKNKAA
ncbi:MAG: SiaB family protein kinase [Cytophagales bacterium]|nr:SiaB family protein kinase [Cytophagales bacterium]